MAGRCRSLSSSKMAIQERTLDKFEDGLAVHAVAKSRVIVALKRELESIAGEEGVSEVFDA